MARNVPLKLQEIERLRGWGLLMVLVGHHDRFQKLLPDWLQHFWGMLDLFFVISGFVVARSFLSTLPKGRSPKLGERFREAGVAIQAFYLRRIFRVLPAALLWLAIPLALSLFIPEFGNPLRLLDSACLVLGLQFNFALSQDPGLFFGHGAGWNPYTHYWSLNVEEQFYLFLPLLLVALGSGRAQLVGALSLILAVVFLIRPMTGTVSPGIERATQELFFTPRRLDMMSKSADRLRPHPLPHLATLSQNAASI